MVHVESEEREDVRLHFVESDLSEDLLVFTDGEKSFTSMGGDRKKVQTIS